MGGKKAINKLRYDSVVFNLDSIYALCDSKLDTAEQKMLFKVRYVNLDSLYSEFSELHLELASDITDAVELEEFKSKYKIITDHYYKTKAVYYSVFENVEKPLAETGKSKHHLVLPSVHIPTFCGKIEEYSHFMDLFEAIVGNDQNLSDSQKMYYLYGALSGEAKSLVQHLSLTGENYSVLLDILKSRYGNKRLQADKLLHTMLSLSHVSKGLTPLKGFLNTLLETTKALEKLKFPVDQWSYLLLYININKIDSSLKRQFEDKYGGSQGLPTFDDFITFLTKEVQILEATDNQKISTSHKVHVSYNNKKLNCLCCNGNHYLNKCEKFIKMTPPNRKKIVINNQLCFRCLNSHHNNYCKTNLTCGKCHSNKHNSLLHFDSRPENNAAVEPPTASTSVNTSSSVPVVTGPSAQSIGSGTQTSNVLHSVSANNTKRTVLLSTAVIRILDRNGSYQEARALIDGGSQSTIVTEECVNRLGLRPKRSGSMSVRGIGGNALHGCKGSVVLRISPKHTNQPIVVTTGLVLNKIADDLPSCSLPQNLSDCYAGLPLADEQFYVGRKIDILIGADIMSDILLGGEIIHVQRGLPCAINTIFGYILQGPVSYSSDNMESYHTFFVNTNTDTLLEKFWETEEVPTSGNLLDPKSVECEANFVKTHYRDDNGRYVVRLPFVSNGPELGESSNQPLKRFYSMERRLQADSNLRQKYIAFMKEYADMGHMTPCDGYQGCQRYIIPHHAVFKPSSDKIRVVFDASCPTISGHSLNDCLHAGPNLQHDIMQVISRFRLFKVVFTTDIRMMFRMIGVHKDDRRFQLIYWRESPELPLQIFELKTVTYGMKSSPYLAVRTLRQLADDGAEEHGKAAEVLRSAVYMDDILSGASSLEAAQHLKQELVALLAKGGFELRKWVSNDRRLLNDIPAEHQEKPHVFDSEGPDFVKILGVQWNPVTDNFTYHTNFDKERNCTKRTILSTLARMFDPMGWIAPVIFQGKCLMQRLWLLNLDWDMKPPPEVIREWEDILGSLPYVERLEIDRFVLADNVVHCSLHAFSDASEKGYGAAVYIRTVDNANNVKVSLMMAKSKVAPTRTKMTIPKLELNGANMLVKLLKYVWESIKDKITVQEIFGWTDSTIVLCWLRMSPHLLQTFEGNRVSQIVNCGLDINWRYLPSEMNPADVASRGCNAKELISHPLWWRPSWLKSNPENWPTNIVGNADNLPGLRKQRDTIRVHAAVALADLPAIQKYSSLSVLISVVAYCMRFANNSKKSSTKTFGPLRVIERDNALVRIIRIVQAESFTEDLERLLNNKQCSTRLRRLKPFIDSSGLIRVGGRLERSSLSYSAKHPVLLPKSHALTSLIVNYYHKLHCHAGATALQAILQRQYWIISARQVIRSHIFKCIQCFRLKTKTEAPLMADLPSDRVNATGVFHTVQTDFAGPFNIKSSRLRNAKALKAYLCVFVCSASKAVHLEVVSDLSTEGFLAAFSRFTSRRGLPKMVRSDCGTNYVGSNRYLCDVQRFFANQDVQNTLSDKVARDGISWQFNPPAASHFGGLFEAAVKSAKTLLRRVIGDQALTFEELVTVFTRIEAVLNSRPLCPLSHDPQDYDALTPGHFLIGRPLLAVPEYQWDNTPDSRLTRFRLLHAMTQRFWKKWSDQYLHTLQMRNKWTSDTDPPKPGDLVVIREENVPPLRWKLARIEELLPGRDGVVRVVNLRTSTGSLTRPVVKICRLPVN